MKKNFRIIIFILLFLVVSRLTYFLMHLTMLNDEKQTYIAKIIFGTIISTYSLLIIRHFRFNYLIGISQPCFKYLLLYLFPLYIVFFLDLSNFSKLTGPQLLLPFAAVFLHAFAEELTIRGIILPTLISKKPITSQTVRASIIISALIFGLVHFVSIVDYDFGSVLAQITYATIHGLFFGILLIKGRNLYLISFCHALINFLNRIKHINQPQFEYTETGKHQSIILTILITIVIFSPLLIISVYYLRRINTNDVKFIKEALSKDKEI